MRRDRHFFIRNSAWVYGAYLIDLCLKLIVIRVMLQRLGPELVGVWGILKTIITFPLFIQEALLITILIRASNKDEPHLSEALVCSAGLGTLAALLISGFASALIRFFNIPGQFHQLLISAFYLTAMIFFATCISEMFLYTLRGVGRFDLAAQLPILTSLLNSVVAIVLIQRGFGLLSLLVLDLVAVITIIPVSSFVCRRAFGSRPLFDSFRAGNLVSLLREAGVQLMLRASAKLLWELDALLIPRFFGIGSMTVYWIARRLPYMWKDLMWLGAQPSIPEVEDNKTSISYLKSIHWLQVILVVPGAIFLFVYSKQILTIWTGYSLVQSTIFMQILTIAVAVDFLPATIFYAFLARGKSAEVARFPLWAAVVKIAFAILFCVLGSTEGLLISTAIGAASFSLPLCYQGSKELGYSFLNLFKPVIPAIVTSLLAALLIFQFWTATSIAQLLLLVSGYALMFSAVLLLMLRIFQPDVYHAMKILVKQPTRL